MAVAGGKVMAVGLSLVGLVGIEAPVAAVGLEEFSGVLADGTEGAVGLTEGVGGRADLNVELAVGAEGEGFGGVLAAIGEVADDALGFAGGNEFAGSAFVAENVIVGGMIQPFAAKGDAGAAAGAELLDLIG